MVRVLKTKNGSTFNNRFRFHFYEAGTQNLIGTTDWSENLVTNANEHGHNLIVRHLYGDVTYALPITHARFGTTDVTPVDTDTDIDSPLAYDIEIASREYIGTTGVRIFFFAPNAFIPDDTYYTFATYCGDQTFSMALIRDFNTVDFVKSGSVDTTIEYEYTIDNA